MRRAGRRRAFLARTVRGLRRLGVRVAVVMTDNGAGYRSHRFAATCRRLGIRQIFTRRYTPRTNGQAERFIKTALLEWAYVRRYRHAEERAQALAAWLHHYNWHRPHTAAHGDPRHPGRLRGQPGETPQRAASVAPSLTPPPAARLPAAQR